MQLVTYDQVKSKIIEIQNQKVILDSDVAELYGVETREINQAISRNPNKFPKNYLIELSVAEWEGMRSQFVTASKRNKTITPVAFTERGLYMLATILKSPKAIGTTIAIIDAFAQIKELTRTVYELSKAKTDSQKVKIFENTTSIIADLLDNKLTVSQHETTFKVKFPFFELSRKITKIKDKN